MGKVLVACEESQTVCKAFRALGHEAYSCDIQEPSGGHPEWHIQGDALEPLKGGTIVTMDEKGIKARNFFLEFWNADVERIVVENPVPMKIWGLPQYSQIIQPYMFGDPYIKTTCLWLKNLPPLFATDIVVPESKWVSSSDHRVKKTADEWAKSGYRSAKQRSKTFPGIARAVATQYGGYI